MKVAPECVGLFGSEIGLNAPQREVHDREAARGCVTLLAVDADIADFAAVRLDEFLRLNEHPSRPAAWIVDAAFVGREHLHQNPYHARWRVELPAVLAFRAGELSQEILVHAPENIFGLVFLVAEADGPDQVDKLSQPMLVQRRPGVVFRQDTLEPRIVAFDGEHGVIQELADGGLLGAPLEVSPSSLFRDPEDVFGEIFVLIFRVRARVVALAGSQLRVNLLERIGDIFQENQAEDDVLVFGGVHVVAKLVGRLPELGFEADNRTIALAGLSVCFWHCHLFCHGCRIVFDLARGVREFVGR
jgi:hypothetical protein